MADISSTLRAWSATAASNAPSGSTAIGGGLDDNLREIQAVVRAYLAGAPNNIASATPDLSNATTNYVNITGTTTITSFGTVSSGIHHIIKFADALTLTHNATSLILPGGANITTAAGDMMLIVSEGSGNWRCINYTYATGQIINGGPVLIGHTALIATFNNSTASGATPNAQQHGLTLDNASAAVALWNATDSLQPQFTFAKSGGATVGSYTAVAANETLGQHRWEGSDGTDFSPAARAYVIVDGAVAAGQVPGRWILETADSAGALQSRMEITSTGAVMIGDTANANNTAGLTVNMGGTDDHALTLKSTDINTVLTSITLGEAVEIDDFFAICKVGAATGGARVMVMGTTSQGTHLICDTYAGSPASTDTSASLGCLNFFSGQHNGSNALVDMGANSNLSVWGEIDSGSNRLTRMLLKADDGELHLGNTTLVALDDEDDALLVRALQKSITVSGIIETQFDNPFYNYDKLKEMNLVGEKDESGFFLFPLQPRLAVHEGAIWQNYVKIKEQDAKIEALTAQLKQLAAP